MPSDNCSGLLLLDKFLDMKSIEPKKRRKSYLITYNGISDIKHPYPCCNIEIILKPIQEMFRKSISIRMSGSRIIGSLACYCCYYEEYETS
jgi:hypothetical protein